jgi:hypothetical protein
MKGQPFRQIARAKQEHLAYKCMFCNKREGILLTTAKETSNRAGIPSRIIYRYHVACLENAINEGHPTAIPVIEAIKQMEELREKRQKFMAEKGISASEWYRQHKNRGKNNERKESTTNVHSADKT